MCLMCEIEKLKLAREGKEKVEENLGVIPEDLYHELIGVDDQLEKVKNEMTAFVKLRVVEEENKGAESGSEEIEELIREEAEAKYKDKYISGHKLHRRIMEDIFKALGADEGLEGDFKINKDTRELIHETVRPIQGATK